MKHQLRKVEARDLVVGRVYQRGVTTMPFLLKRFVYLSYSKKIDFTCMYLHSNIDYDSVLTSEKYFYEVLDHPTTTNQKETTMTNQLYQVIGEETYGYIIGTNSNGDTVFEVKGSGAICTLPKSSIEKVMPYTVGVKFINGANNKSYNFFAHKDDFSVGDVVVNQNYGGVVLVVDVDTKSEGAKNWLTGSVLSVSKVVTADNE